MDQNKELEKKIKRLKEDYKIIFGSEEGQRVIGGHLYKMS